MKCKQCLIALQCALVCAVSPSEQAALAQKAVQPAGLTLDVLVAGQLAIVDLTYALGPEIPFWPGEDYKPFELKTIATIEKDGVLSKAFCMPEHMGTHLDAPNHFEKGQSSVEQIPPADFFAEGVKIDVAAQAAGDADYRLTLADVKSWENTNGEIPAGAIVLLETGWGRFWKMPVRYRNQDAQGRMHFPGYSAEAAEYLIVTRKAKGIGIDTLSMDYGLSRDFAVHHVVNKHGRYGLENVAKLDQLPARGFYLVVAPIKLETGTGGPTRIFAIVRPAATRE